MGLANTSVAFIDNTLLALAESDLPYSLRLMPDGDIETVGRWDLGGKLKMAMTAHPKVDPVTGEVFSFRYGPFRPFLRYFRIGAEGRKDPDIPIFSFRQPSFVHDTAITERYDIFPDIQLMMKPLGLLKGEEPLMGYDGGKVGRVGVIPRYATDESEMKWRGTGIRLRSHSECMGREGWRGGGAGGSKHHSSRVHTGEDGSDPVPCADGEDQPQGRDGTL